MKKRKKNLSVILPNIRSLFNVGSIFRTAECAGFDTIYLCGWTGTPPAPGISKVALGAEDVVSWQHHTQAWRVIDSLKAQGAYVVGVEYTENSIDYRSVKIPDTCVFIMGNEVDGLNDTLLKRCDIVMHLPMVGVKESLNVSVAFGIVAYYAAFNS